VACFDWWIPVRANKGYEPSDLMRSERPRSTHTPSC
jgi:hypothetical protein